MKRARKVSGSYEATGTIVAEFKTTAGEPRCVFEFDVPKGLLHIFKQDQLEIEATPRPGYKPPGEKIAIAFRLVGTKKWIGGFYKGSSYWDKNGLQAWAPSEVAEWRCL